MSRSLFFNSLVKLAKAYVYGNRFAGGASFDDSTNIRLVKDKNSDEDVLAPFFAGVNSVVSADGASTSPAHSRLGQDRISELASNSLSSDKEALKAYIERYARTMEDYKAEHGRYPKQRIIGHSRGGGGALEFMEALYGAHPELPRVDEYIGLDPYDLPGKKEKRTRRNDKTYMARHSIIVRPKRPGVIKSDASDMDGNGKIGMNEKIYSHLANLITDFGRRMNPFSRRTSIGVAVPGVHHSSAPEMLDAALALSPAKSKRKARKILREMFGDEDPALLESGDSPLYGDYDSPIYEKS